MNHLFLLFGTLAAIIGLGFLFDICLQLKRIADAVEKTNG